MQTKNVGWLKHRLFLFETRSGAVLIHFMVLENSRVLARTINITIATTLW